MNPILIHKGDCTIFANVNKFLTFNLETELDLTGWQAKFILGWVEKTIDDISTHSFEIILGAEDTKQLRLGEQYGTIILTDSNGNIKTVTNSIPFEVTTAVIENEYQEIDLTIPESSGVDIRLKVGASTVTSVNGMTGDVILDIPSIEGLATEKQLEDGLDTKQDKGDYALKEEIPDLTNYVKDTDYPASGKAGVVRVGSYVGTNAMDGFLCGNPRTLEQYNSAINQIVIAKATLENIKDDYVKRGLTENTIELTADEKANAKAWLGYAEPNDIMQAIASIPQFKLSIVNELPLAGEKMTLYLVPKEGTNNDVYDEYIWIEQTSTFEHLGTTAVDLTDYVKNTDYATDTVGGVVKINNTFFGLAFNSSKQLYVYKAPETDITNKSSHYRPIVPTNLDFAVKTSVTTNTIELTDDEKTSARTWLGAVGNTDYATASKAGVLTPSSYYGTAMSGQYLYTQTKTLDQYKEGVNGMFVGKGTLENIKNDFVKRAVTQNDIELTDDEKTSARTWIGAIGTEDYANATTAGSAGIVKCSSTFACGCTNGYIQAMNIPTLERYNNLSQYAFIGKATLETALTQYSKTVLTTEADYNALETKDSNTLYLIEE